MRGLIVIGIIVTALFSAHPVWAAAIPPEISEFSTNTINIITLISTAAAVFFLIKGGYLYITSTGRPDVLEDAKRTIRNALIGLVVVLSAGVLVTTFRSALDSGAGGGSDAAITLSQIESAKPNGGLTQVLIDAVSGFMQNIVESATKPLVDGIVAYLANTPSLLSNSVVMKFWLISLGIADSLFVVVVALLGLHFMSASTFGFEEVELKRLLPRIGLAFLGTNVSLFFADYAIVACNALVNAVLNATGGLNHAWITNAVTLQNAMTQSTPVITLVFLMLFVIVAIVLLLMYISRLIVISLGAVLSPFVFLLWTLPRFSDFADVAIKTYLVSVFMIFVHIVTIQLAASFLTLPEHTENSILSIAVAIGLFLTLLKIPSFMMQMVLFTSRNGSVKKIGNQIMNVLSTDNAATASRTATVQNGVKVPRKVLNV